MKQPVIMASVVILCASCDGTGIELTSGDAVDDRRVDPDVYYDPPWEPPYDPPRDPPPEPLTDLPDDPCAGLTAPFGGICSIVEQCGCMPGFACDFQVDAATCLIIENCVGGTGTLPVEAECAAAGMCRPGTSCIVGDGATVGRCREWCRDSSDCSLPGRECSETVTFTMPSPCTGTGSVPYMVCSLACPPSAECDLFATGSDPTGCPYGEACIRDIPIVSGGCDINLCIPEGPGIEYEDCDGGYGCLRGMGCYGNDTDGYHCLRYCDPSHECTTGTCITLGSESWPDLGICI